MFLKKYIVCHYISKTVVIHLTEIIQLGSAVRAQICQTNMLEFFSESLGGETLQEMAFLSDYRQRGSWFSVYARLGFPQRISPIIQRNKSAKDKATRKPCFQDKAGKLSKGSLARSVAKSTRETLENGAISWCQNCGGGDWYPEACLKQRICNSLYFTLV